MNPFTTDHAAMMDAGVSEAHAGIIAQAQAAGFSLFDILNFVLKYGPGAMEMLKKFLELFQQRAGQQG